MYDDAILAAALARGPVEHCTFHIRDHVLLHGGEIIRNCTFHGPMYMLRIPASASNITITGCMFREVPRDEMTPLYDLLEESHGRTQA